MILDRNHIYSVFLRGDIMRKENVRCPMCGTMNYEVDVRFTPDGKIRPLAINYDKSHIYGIDRVLAVRRGTSRLGGKGQCFTCMICG